MLHFFYDTETGGKTAKQSLLTLYGIVTDENFEKIDEISLAIKPNNGIYRVSAESLEINGINLVEHNKIALTEAQAQVKLRDFLLKHSGFGKEKLHPAGWNNYWDNAFVKRYILPDFEDFFSRHCLDVAGISVLLKSMGRLPADLKISLGSLADHYQSSFLTQAHDAKSDAWMTITVLKCMIRDLNAQKL